MSNPPIDLAIQVIGTDEVTIADRINEMLEKYPDRELLAVVPLDYDPPKALLLFGEEVG